MANGLAWGRWLAILPITAALTAGLYIDFPMIPLALGISALFIVYWRVNGRAKVPFSVWLISMILALLLYQPWWSRAATLFTLLNNIHFFSAIRQTLHLPPFTAVHYALLLITASVGLTLMLGAAYKLLQITKIRRIVTPLAVLLFIGLSIAFVWPRFYGLKRVLATGWPYVCLAVAWLVVAWEGNKGRRFMWAGSLAVSLLATLLMLWAVPKDDWRGAVAYIEAQAQAEDIVWLDPSWNQTAYEYYQADTTAYWGDIETLAQVAQTDIWLVAERFPSYETPSSESEAWLDEHLQLVAAIPFYRLEVRHYRPEN
jgi:hypothetical protein